MILLCATCGIEHDVDGAPPDVCDVCADARQYVPKTGQEWVCLDELRHEGARIELTELEPGLWGLHATPQVDIGQTALLATTPRGNLLWDVPGMIDDESIARVRELGGIAAIATSHPHMFGTQLEWSAAFDDAAVFVAAPDAGWLRRTGPAIRTWDDRVEPVPGLPVIRVGGHFPGSAVALWRGADGRGVLLAGDSIMATPAPGWVSFLRSYPNMLPLSASVVRRVADRVAELDYDRLYSNFANTVDADAAAAVQRSADRYIAYLEGEVDADT